jgi:alpha-galactosidase/6-phospho-beta-glucosidase family protein
MLPRIQELTAVGLSSAEALSAWREEQKAEEQQREAEEKRQAREERRQEREAEERRQEREAEERRNKAVLAITSDPGLSDELRTLALATLALDVSGHSLTGVSKG